MHKATGKTGKGAKRASPAPPRAFRWAEHLKTNAERAAYLEALLEDGDNRVIPLVNYGYGC
jgi:hypothetical protein